MRNQIVLLILITLNIFSCDNENNNNPNLIFEEIKISTQNLIDVSFLNDKVGVILASWNNLYITYDSGLNWEHFNPNIDDYLSSVEFADSNALYLSGYFVYKSTYLLNRYTKISTWEKSSRIQNINFLDKDTGYILHNGIVKTVDGGRDWNQVLDNDYTYCQMCPLNNISFYLNGKIGYATGGTTHDGSSIGFIYKTSEFGEKWLPVPKNIAEISSQFFWNQDKGIIFTTNGEIYITSNGLLDTEQISNDCPCMYPSVVFIKESEGIMACNNNIYFSENRGKDWVSIYATDKDIKHLYLINPDYLICICKDGYIIKIKTSS